MGTDSWFCRPRPLPEGGMAGTEQWALKATPTAEGSGLPHISQWGNFSRNRYPDQLPLSPGDAQIPGLRSSAWSSDLLAQRATVALLPPVTSAQPQLGPFGSEMRLNSACSHRIARVQVASHVNSENNIFIQS